MTAKAVKRKLNKLYHTSINGSVEISPELKAKHKARAQAASEELKQGGMVMEPIPCPTHRPAISPDGEYESDYEEDDEDE